MKYYFELKYCMVELPPLVRDQGGTLQRPAPPAILHTYTYTTRVLSELKSPASSLACVRDEVREDLKSSASALGAAQGEVKESGARGTRGLRSQSVTAAHDRPRRQWKEGWRRLKPVSH